MVSRLAAEHVKVVLSGEGGDELFGGYDRYVVESRERRYRLPAAARTMLDLAARALPDGMRGRNLLRHFSLADPERYLDAVTLLRLDEQRRLFRPDAFERLAADDPWRGPAAPPSNPRGPGVARLPYPAFSPYPPLGILAKVHPMS